METVEEVCTAPALGSRSVRWAVAQMRIVAGITLAIGLGVTGCGVSFAPLPAGSAAGRAGAYDYSPSVIQSGTLQQIWWCGDDYNPTDTTQLSDTIQYESTDLSTQVHTLPTPVLGETPGAWDSVFTCNPKVVSGAFTNPLGDGESFAYAMYYVGLGSTPGSNNSIGVAFSNDGVSWKKYPQPIISPETRDGYGVGQPAVYNDDHQQAIRVFYEDDSFYVHHVEAVSKDGVHFATVGVLTTQGLVSNSLSWGDMAYDPGDGYWYAGFNTGLRDPATTGNVFERGQYGIQIYRILDASLLTGATPWELIINVDTSLTGYEANFLPGLVRDPYGNLIASPAIQMITSISNPAPPWDASPSQAGTSADIGRWNLSSFAINPNQSPMTLNRYFNQTSHEVTTGWIDPKGGFSLQASLGHLYQGPQQGATTAFYGCKSGSMDYFVSLDSACEGARILGMNGYGYSQPVAGLTLSALYRCKTSTDHFVSTDSKCEGSETQELLGYVLP